MMISEDFNFDSRREDIMNADIPVDEKIRQQAALGKEICGQIKDRLDEYDAVVQAFQAVRIEVKEGFPRRQVLRFMRWRSGRKKK